MLIPVAIAFYAILYHFHRTHVVVMPDEREIREKDEEGKFIHSRQSGKNGATRSSREDQRQKAILRTPPDIQDLYLLDEISKNQIVALGVYVPDPKAKSYDQAIASYEALIPTRGLKLLNFLL